MNLKIVFLIIISFLVVQCKQATEKNENTSASNEIKYAEGFSIKSYDTFKIVTIFRGYIGDQKASDFYLFSKLESIPDSLVHKNIIRIPLDKIVVTSTTHIPMLEAVGAEQKLIGFPNHSFISSPKTRDLIEQGLIADLGNEQALNQEILLQLKPDLLMGFGVDQPSSMYQNIEKLGILVLMNGDWMEKNPLGRSEWIKLFGALFDKDSLASEKFRQIESNYLRLQKLAQSSKVQPTVISGSLFQGTWYTPGGESFLAQMFRDANASYIWKDSKGTGSLSLSLESVLEKGKNADYWIAPGDFEYKIQLQKAHNLYDQFDAFQKNNIYSYAHLKGKTNGFIYFEVSPLRPDWILEDFIQIFHPELGIKNDFHFFKKI